jgi:hypothetical protein
MNDDAQTENWKYIEFDWSKCHVNVCNIEPPTLKICDRVVMELWSRMFEREIENRFSWLLKMWSKCLQYWTYFSQKDVIDL